MPARMTIDQLLSEARRRLKRLDPVAAPDAVASGALLIDIRSERQRERDGLASPDAWPLYLQRYSDLLKD